MLARYYEAVTGAFVPLRWRRSVESEGRFDLVRRARLVAALSGLAGILVAIMLAAGLARGATEDSLVVTFLSALYYLLVPFTLRRAKTATVAALLFIAPVFVAFPIRAIGLGGVGSSIVYWYALVPVFAGLLLTRRWAVLATLLAVAEICALCAHAIITSGAEARSEVVARGVSMISVLSLLLAMTLFFEAERERREATIHAQGARLRGVNHLAALGRAVVGVTRELRAPTEQLKDLAALMHEPEGSDQAAREKLADDVEGAANRIGEILEELGALDAKR
jgi:signal transduction histidine kinase